MGEGGKDHVGWEEGKKPQVNDGSTYTMDPSAATAAVVEADAAVDVDEDDDEEEPPVPTGGTHSVTGKGRRRYT